MRICLVGDFTGTPDEGMKNVSRTTYEFLSANHDVLVLTGRTIFKPSVIRRFIYFRPQVIHYLHGPTIRSLVILKVLQLLSGKDTRTVVSATRPYFSKFTRRAVPLLKPDLVLTQSSKFEQFFQTRGCRVAFLPNGVDCHKFAPVDTGTKKRLRRKYNMPLDKKIVLHVGHIRKNRKLDLFMDIQKIPDLQVVVAGGTVEKTDEDLKDKLKNSGVKVIHRYLDDISELYKAADLYVFPISDHSDALPENYNQVGSIDLPLSVLEAMACNLPVISTRFGALPRLFKQGGGFEYVETREEIVNKLKTNTMFSTARTRNTVLPLDWERIIGDLETRYLMLIEEPGSCFAAVSNPHHINEKGLLP